MNTLLLAMTFIAASQTNSLPKGLLSSLCWVESRHKPSAVNKTDGSSPSLGLCQVKLSTARLLGFKGTSLDLMDPKVNAHYAAKYLRKQIVRYKGNIKQAVGAYNAGTYRENSQGVPINSQYIRKVFVAWTQTTYRQ